MVDEDKLDYKSTATADESEDVFYDGGNMRSINLSIDPYQGKLMPRTNLVQLYCDTPENAPGMISEIKDHKNSRLQAHETPIMVIINKPSCVCCLPCTWCKCMRNIPQGMMILE